ncbi:MAG: AIR synthase related protein, partial [Alphaproteobacteria bacterium]
PILYDRPHEPTPKQPVVAAAEVPVPADYGRTLLDMIGGPDLCSRRWVWEQYDHMVMGDTTQAPGGDAAVVRVHGTERGLAMATDCTPRYCLADPETGGRQAVAETWRNMTAVGAMPLALTNNLNFGNPERPHIMGQIVGCIAGMRAAATALRFPVVSGNVSLYNETNGRAIAPAPVIGGVGLIEDLAQVATIGFRAAGETVILIGETQGWLGCTLYQRHATGGTAGAPPPVDLDAERKAGDLVRGLIRDGTVATCHDLSDGGLIVALAEMAMAGDMGAAVDVPADAPPLHAWLFGEDQGRYLVATAKPDAVLAAAKRAGVPAAAIGRTGGTSLTVDGACTISVAELRAAHEGWLPRYMAAP